MLTRTVNTVISLVGRKKTLIALVCYSLYFKQQSGLKPDKNILISHLYSKFRRRNHHEFEVVLANNEGKNSQHSPAFTSWIQKG